MYSFCLLHNSCRTNLKSNTIDRPTIPSKNQNCLTRVINRVWRKCPRSIDEVERCTNTCYGIGIRCSCVHTRCRVYVSRVDYKIYLEAVRGGLLCSSGVDATLRRISPPVDGLRLRAVASSGTALLSSCVLNLRYENNPDTHPLAASEED